MHDLPIDVSLATDQQNISTAGAGGYLERASVASQWACGDSARNEGRT